MRLRTFIHCFSYNYFESQFKKHLNHINFSKNNKDVNSESFRKLDPYSHPTEESYLNYYLPTLLEKIKLIQN